VSVLKGQAIYVDALKISADGRTAMIGMAHVPDPPQAQLAGDDRSVVLWDLTHPNRRRGLVALSSLGRTRWTACQGVVS
jgi:hypothetical protein